MILIIFIFLNIMKLLQISSLFFSTVTIHAYYVHNIFYHHISLLITILSLLNHAENPSIYIKIIDTIIAHYAFFQITITDTSAIIEKKPIMILPSFIISFCFWYESLYPFYATEIHFMLHLIASGTLHSYLYYLEN